MLHLSNGRTLPVRKNRVESSRRGSHTHPMNDAQAHPHYHLVARAIRELTTGNAPTLAGLADRLGVSEFHLQRIFTEWAGVSPKRFLQFISKERALEALRSERDVLNASFSAGLVIYWAWSNTLSIAQQYTIMRRHGTPIGTKAAAINTAPSASARCVTRAEAAWGASSCPNWRSIRMR